ncbi:MAG: hypothetical protein ACE37B_01205 [Ilumatobacter sp.]|uniref:hypothetical protein n=1 Tax=Ilumatobacter sp. TaxID=1967498 RepID=UPI00391B7C32
MRLLDALDTAGSGQGEADDLATALETYRAIIGPNAEDDVVAGFTDTVDALVHAVRWRASTWDAEPDAERYATAARLRAGKVLARGTDRWPERLTKAVADLAELSDLDTAADVAISLSRIALPTRLTELFRESNHAPSQAVLPSSDPVAIAAVMIRFRGQPVMRPTVLQPGALHSFEIEARVAEWPPNADALDVSFISVYPRDFLFATGARFTPDSLTQTVDIRIAGSRPPDDPPIGLTAQAAFLSDGKLTSARLAGNTTLEVVTFDERTAQPLQIPTAALRLQQLMSELTNAIPNLTSTDRTDARLLLEGVLRFAHTVLDDRLGSTDTIDEAWFQYQLRQFLQADPGIGARLGERIGLAGGTTDLILGNIVLELKVAMQSSMSWKTAAEKYTGQPTQYASAGDSQVSLVAVLDASPKRAPAGVMGNEIGWAYPELASGPDPRLPSLVGVVVIRSGFPVPSNFSR